MILEDSAAAAETAAPLRCAALTTAEALLRAVAHWTREGVSEPRRSAQSLVPKFVGKVLAAAATWTLDTTLAALNMLITAAEAAQNSLRPQIARVVEFAKSLLHCSSGQVRARAAVCLVAAVSLASTEADDRQALMQSSVGALESVAVVLTKMVDPSFTRGAGVGDIDATVLEGGVATVAFHVDGMTQLVEQLLRVPGTKVPALRILRVAQSVSGLDPTLSPVKATRNLVSGLPLPPSAYAVLCPRLHASAVQLMSSLLQHCQRELYPYHKLLMELLLREVEMWDAQSKLRRVAAVISGCQWSSTD